MSATYPALVCPGVPHLPLNRVGNLYTTVSGAGPGLGVVDLDTNMRDRLAIAGVHVGVAMQDEALLTKCHRSILIESCHSYWDSTELSCMYFVFKDECKFNVYISEVCFEKCRRIDAWREVVSFSEVLCLGAMLGSCTWYVANWMFQVTRVSHRWFIGSLQPIR